MTKLSFLPLLLLAAACSEAVAPVPEAFAVSYSAQVADPATGQLVDAPLPARDRGSVMASTVGGGSQEALLVADGAIGLATAPAHSDRSYTDPAGRANKVVFLYHQAGPVSATYHFVNAKLVSYSTFAWTKIPGGYYNSLQTLHVVDPKGVDLGAYQLQGTYTTTTKPCNPAAPNSHCAPPQIVRGPTPVQRKAVSALLAFAHACGVQDALAQNSPPCVAEWILYGVAMSALIGEAAVPVIGWASAIPTWAAASVALAIAIRCQQGKTAPLFGGGSGGGGGAESGGCGDGNITDACVTLTLTE